MEKILLITDTDLDGVSCGILAKLFFKDVYVHNASIDVANELIMSKCLSDISSPVHFDNYTKIYITDLGLSKSTLDLIQMYNSISKRDKVILFDHHKSTLDVVKEHYTWANVHVHLNDDETHPTCGTELFWNHIQELHFSNDKNGLYSNYSVNRIEKCHRYVELVRLYDTFEWKKVSNGREASDMNALFTIYPRLDFMNNIIL